MEDWIQQHAILDHLNARSHVWLFELDVCLEYCLSNSMRLSAEEVERWRGFQMPTDQSAFLARRVLLKTLIARYLRIPAERVMIVEGQGRKPGLAPSLTRELAVSLEFSVSRSGRSIAIAFSLEQVGIDLEIVREFADVDDVLVSCCTPEEARALRNEHHPRFWDRFFRIWTGKEAVAKARGLGLSMDFSTFSLPEEPSSFRRPAFVTGLGAKDRSLWLGFERFQPSPGEAWMLALASYAWQETPEVFRTPSFL